MSDPIIIVENLGKKYRLRHQQNRQKYLSLREVLMDKSRAVGQRFRRVARTFRGNKYFGQQGPAIEDFWALRDVSFEINRGESVGIIGRNGAGKSTLLKILSRITEPTTGRFRLCGRMASLLEVGTGFHPELTGRENIYLNGAVLGMTRVEIIRKFDEIVSFAEIEKFLDTPVKRYSSGMYVRLAFAVAAHLEPEILVVDEVLAVGDAEFQKKCLGKMGEVARGGRTVIFVSHNMAAVQNLCSLGILLKDGQVAHLGAIADVVSEYLLARKKTAYEPIAERIDREGDGRVRVIGLTANDQPSGSPVTVCCGDKVVFKLKYEVNSLVADPAFAIGIWDAFGTQVLYMNNRMAGNPIRLTSPRMILRCQIPRLTLAPGQYFVHVSVSGDNGRAVDRIEGAMTLNVEKGSFFPSTDTTTLSYGKCLIDHTWVDNTVGNVEAG